jgi:hypothetical protein
MLVLCVPTYMPLLLCVCAYINAAFAVSELVNM